LWIVVLCITFIIPSAVNGKRSGSISDFVGNLAAPALPEAAYNLSIHPEKGERNARVRRDI
jgi:hypothetical protein